MGSVCQRPDIKDSILLRPGSEARRPRPEVNIAGTP